jgi:hypothetical protein
MSKELYNRFNEHDRKVGDMINRSNKVLDQLEKITKGLNKHLKETGCEHCKEVLKKIFSEMEMN